MRPKACFGCADGRIVEDQREGDVDDGARVAQLNHAKCASYVLSGARTGSRNFQTRASQFCRLHSRQRLTVAENSREQIWPALDYSEWRETCATLQLWTQIVGKIRLALGPWINHSWGVTLYVTVRGLTTSLIPYGSRAFEIEFDFTRHELRIITAEGDEV